MKKRTTQAVRNLDPEVLREMFRYEPETGFLYWKNPVSSQNRGAIGVKAKTPYMQVGINYKVYLVHRIIFAIHHGCCASEIDHIDGNPRNNKIENLREVTRSENTINRKHPIGNNTSGHTGISYSKKFKRWRAYIKKDGNFVSKFFLSKKEAILFRNQMVKELYPNIS